MVRNKNLSSHFLTFVCMVNKTIVQVNQEAYGKQSNCFEFSFLTNTHQHHSQLKKGSSAEGLFFSHRKSPYTITDQTMIIPSNTKI